MKILGVDPGSTVVGYGVVAAPEPGASRVPRLLECGVIRTTAGAPLPNRLRAIHEGLMELLARHQPDVVAVEDIFFGHNARSTAVLGHARGVILLSSDLAGVTVVEYAPARIKKAIVGRGAARKPQVGYMVAKILNLSAAPSPADAADGVAVALTHLLLMKPMTRAVVTR
jgi:crossover junction endodeoxyribonuclease RuvC